MISATKTESSGFESQSGKFKQVCEVTEFIIQNIPWLWIFPAARRQTGPVSSPSLIFIPPFGAPASRLKAPLWPLWPREGKRRSSENCSGRGRCWRGCKRLAVGGTFREPEPPPAEVPGGCSRPEQVPPPTPHAPSLFGVLEIFPSASAISCPRSSPSPGSGCPCGEVLAPNPAKLLLTCVLCVLQTFHSAVASEARIPC